MNGFGRPICLEPMREKDLVNAQCLSGDTLVRVKDWGWKRIDNCSAHDLIWDGHSWVRTDGLINKGKSLTQHLDGVQLTKDHKVLTNDGWIEAKDCRTEALKRPAIPDATWQEVWRLSNYLIKQVAQTLRLAVSYLRRG